MSLIALFLSLAAYRAGKVAPRGGGADLPRGPALLPAGPGRCQGPPKGHLCAQPVRRIRRLRAQRGGVALRIACVNFVPLGGHAKQTRFASRTQANLRGWLFVWLRGER